MPSTEFWLTALVVVLIPGTGVLYTVATALFHGRRSSLFATVGCTFGIVPSLLASITGLALVIHTSATAFQALKFVGVAYLLYLAWDMLNSSGALSLEEGYANRSDWNIAVKGFLINILNPKLTIFFLAFLPQFVPVDAPAPTQTMLTLGVCFMAMTLVVFLGYAFVAGVMRDRVIASERAATVLQRVFAGSFAALGLRLAFSSRD